jgi:colicin import membrane protein
MQVKSIFVIPALLGALLLTACGEKAEQATDAAAGAATEAVQDAATATTDAAKDAATAVVEAVPAAAEPGGYVPTPEELIPGETRPVEAAPAANEPAPAPATN